MKFSTKPDRFILLILWIMPPPYMLFKYKNRILRSLLLQLISLCWAKQFCYLLFFFNIVEYCKCTG